MNEEERRLMSLTVVTPEAVARALRERHEHLRRMLKHDLGDDRALVEHCVMALLYESWRVRASGLTPVSEALS